MLADGTVQTVRTRCTVFVAMQRTVKQVGQDGKKHKQKKLVPIPMSNVMHASGFSGEEKPVRIKRVTYVREEGNEREQFEVCCGHAEHVP